MSEALAERPAHVPEDRIVDFNFLNPPGAEKDVHLAWAELYKHSEIVWTPHNGGHWIATRADVIEDIQKDFAHFSHAKGISLPMGLKPVRYLPLESDPPEHAAYRQLLNPTFGPANIAALKEEARELSIGLIEGFRDRGECEFIGDFAEHLPVTIFLRLVDLPLDDREKFLNWANEAVRFGTHESRRATFQKISAYLGEIIKERREKPGDDLISKIATSEVAGGKMTQEEALGMALVLFIGGLDTVVNMLAFFALFLARNPKHRKQLVDDPTLIPGATEELIRCHGLSNTVRTLTSDYDYRGLHLKKGDVIQVPTSLGGLDENRFDNPFEVDFLRQSQRHTTFGNGPHRCMGAPLGRAELFVFLEEWLKRIPDFEIKPGATIRMRSGSVNSIESVPLVWSVN